MMVAFIYRRRETLGVESICGTLQFAPSAYYERKRQNSDPRLRSTRRKADETLRAGIPRVWADNFRVYGARKVWRQLGRESCDVARCTIERLMRKMGLQGVIRGRRKRTTIPADLDLRPLDLVLRQFRADRPNQLWVADFTYVATWSNFVYTAFVHGRNHHRLVQSRGDLAAEALKSRNEVERATLSWVHWFNTQRLLAPIGNVPPAEFEKAYFAGLESSSVAAGHI